MFNHPSEVDDAAAKAGYRACSHAANHSWDQGADGITRLWNTLDQDGIAQTGSYKTEEDSTKPLVIDSPTGGGKLGLIAGTVSLNAHTPDYDWRVDRLRESGDPNHQADIDKAVAKAKEARKQGADVVAITDGQMSPLYRMATVSLLVRSDMISFVDSMAAPLSLLNALIVAVGRQKNEEVSGTFSQLENDWSKYNIFGKTEDES